MFFYTKNIKVYLFFDEFLIIITAKKLMLQHTNGTIVIGNVKHNYEKLFKTFCLAPTSECKGLCPLSMYVNMYRRESCEVPRFQCIV